MTKLISSVNVLIEAGFTDASGSISFFVDPNTAYTFTFSKPGLPTITSVLTIGSSDLRTIIMGASAASGLNSSVFTGFNHTFRPFQTELTNDTVQQFNFTVQESSVYWSLSSCFIFIMDENLTVLNSSNSSGSPICRVSTTFDTGNFTTLLARGVYLLNGTINVTQLYTYNVFAFYQGEFSMQTWIDDINAFSSAGFDDFTRGLIAFLVVLLVTGSVSVFFGLTNPNGLIVLFVMLTWAVSYVGWLTINNAFIPFAGLQQYLLFLMVFMVGGAFLAKRVIA